VNDSAVVSAQIGRPVRGQADVIARCHLGLPVVTRVPPILDDGTPFPTLYWLSCPLAVRRLARLESEGGISTAEERLASEPEAAARMEAAHRRYEAERDRRVPGGADPKPRGGIGGMRGPGVKCLHAHYADRAAGNDNPVGEWSQAAIEPLDCTVACVVEVGGDVHLNPDWREPK
jgi:hypothetical protein